MKLYIGGAFQGQEELAREENPGSVLLPDFHEKIREALLHGEDPLEYAERVFRETPDAVIVANEVGSGVVPADPAERAFREAAGRALCAAARRAESVTRCVCGIGVRIK